MVCLEAKKEAMEEKMRFILFFIWVINGVTFTAGGVRSIITCCEFISIVTAMWIPSPPKTNVWVTLANVTGQDTICLAILSPENPFTTCLVSVPTDQEIWEHLADSTNAHLAVEKEKRYGRNWTVDMWDQWTAYLPQASSPLQELELLGSVKMDWCVTFNYSGKNQLKGRSVNATISAYKNSTLWCNYTAQNCSRSSNVSLALPSGLFLVCGDHAWPGIPPYIKGSPCSLGRLTLLMPNMTMIVTHYRQHKRQQRAAHAFDEHCSDDIDFWNRGKIIAASIFVPGVAAARALASMNKLGCWLSKQSNATSQAVHGLLLDVDSIYHATLQNRAAIDFLLLAHGHGCEDLDGMCCMNLSDHSVSVSQSIQQLRDGVQKLPIENSWGWFDNWFQGLGPWMQKLAKLGIMCLLVFVCLMICVPCIISCVRKMIDKAVKQVLVVQVNKEKGGIVGDFLEENGHVFEIE